MAVGFGERLLAAVAVLDRGRGNHQRPEQSQGIDDQMPLAAGDFFFRRRSLSAPPARWSSRFGYRGSPPSASAFYRPGGGPAPAGPRGVVPRCRPAASGESNERQCGRAGNHVARPARYSRYGFGRRWH
jgi:hypothetical protein